LSIGSVPGHGLRPGRAGRDEGSPSPSDRPPHVREAVWERFRSGEEACGKLKAEPRTIVIDRPRRRSRGRGRPAPRRLERVQRGARLPGLRSDAVRGGDRARSPTAGPVRPSASLSTSRPSSPGSVQPRASGLADRPVRCLRVRAGHPLRGRIRSRPGRSWPLPRGGSRDRARHERGKRRTARAIATQLGEIGLASASVSGPPPSSRNGSRVTATCSSSAGLSVRRRERRSRASPHEGCRAPARAAQSDGYSSPEFDEAIENALRAAEPESRLPLLQGAIRVLDRELPWVPLFTIRSVRVHPANLKLRFRSDGMLLLADLAPAEKGGTRLPGADGRRETGQPGRDRA